MAVSLQLTTDAAVLAKVTRLLPCVAPKLTPEIATHEPTVPDPGANPIISGGAGVAAPTVSVVEPQIEPAHALTVAKPGAAPKADP
jgi:hypothetical protein